MANDTVIVIPSREVQDEPPRVDETYKVYASNLKLATSFGRLLGSVSLFIPAFELHVACRWVRDERGNERVIPLRVKVEAPDGKIHNKSVIRWGTAQAEERFQRAGLKALHKLIAKTATSGDHSIDPHRFAPLFPAASLEVSALQQQQKDV
jgi:hypothetical protein